MILKELLRTSNAWRSAVFLRMEKTTDLHFQLTFILTPLADIMVIETRK
jgi:hypothetical protein